MNRDRSSWQHEGPRASGAVTQAEHGAVTQPEHTVPRGVRSGWFYGFRLAARTDLGSRLVRAWAIVPAAINERDLVPGLIEGADYLSGLLTDKGFNGKQFAQALAAQGHPGLGPTHHGTGPPRRPHLLGHAHPYRLHRRRSHPQPDHGRGCMNPHNAPK